MQSKEMYSPNGIPHCQKSYIDASSNKFYYYWIDANVSDFGTSTNRYEVVIPVGYYDVHELNSIFESVMINNAHYFLYGPTRSKIFLMKIIFNNTNNCVEIQSFSTANVSDSINYTIPQVARWSRPTNAVVPVYYIPAAGFQNIIGFSTGHYPDVISNSTANKTVNGASYGALSNIASKILPSYSITYHKPSNNRFATQGGVSSSDMTQRIKYETISRNGLAYSTSLGLQVGNAMSYGVSDKVYTVKDKIGYPVRTTPVIDKYTGAMRRLANGKRTDYCVTAPSS